MSDGEVINAEIIGDEAGRVLVITAGREIRRHEEGWILNEFMYFYPARAQCP